jgi:hypothetical protein
MVFFKVMEKGSGGYNSVIIRESKNNKVEYIHKIK